MWININDAKLRDLKKKLQNSRKGEVSNHQSFLKLVCLEELRDFLFGKFLNFEFSMLIQNQYFKLQNLIQFSFKNCTF